MDYRALTTGSRVIELRVRGQRHSIQWFGSHLMAIKKPAWKKAITFIQSQYSLALLRKLEEKIVFGEVSELNIIEPLGGT